MNKPIFRMGLVEDIPRMKHLWSLVFTEDPPEFVGAFFDIIDPMAECCCALIGDELVSMLFLLPANASNELQTYSVRYLYAGCTHPAFRGHGLYSELMAFAEKQAKLNEAVAIYLHPASASLFDYYTRLGYRRGIQRIDKPDASFSLPSFSLEPRYTALFSAWEDEDKSAAECMWLPLVKHTELIEFMQQGAVTFLLGD